MNRILPSDVKATLDPSRNSRIDSANDLHCDFPIQNLPFGAFSDARNLQKRAGVTIGDVVADLAVLAGAGRLEQPVEVFTRPALK